MGDKAIITDILEASHLTDAYITVKPQDLLDLVHISSHSAAAEGETSVKYENFQEEEKQEGKERLSFGSTQIRSEGESTDSSDSESAGLLPFSKVSGRTAKFRSADTFTVDQAVDALGFGKFQLKLSFLTGLAWMADAMEMMILSILSPALKCDWWLESWQQALITTIVFCGMMLSSTMWGNINDRYGRKSGLVLCTSITFYFGLLSAFAPSYIWLLILRGLVGFGIGGVPQSVTLYAEFLPSTHRAKCVVLIEAFWAIGTCAEVLLALFVMPTLGWRWLLAFSAFPLLIFTMSCVWLPESARYHVASGQLDLAYATLERVAKENGKPMLLGKLVDVQNVAVNGISETTKRGRMVDLFVPELRITTLLLWFIWFANAFSYYGIVLLTTELFQSGDSCHGGEADAVVTGEKPDCYLDCKQLGTKDYMDLLWTTLAEFPGLIITALIIEWLGRKKTMAIEFVIFSMFVYCLFACSTRTVVTIFIFIARAFISGAFQGAYVYTPEVYPTTTRAIGLGSCSMFARLGAIITPFVSQVAINTSVNIPIATYASVCLVAAVASLLLPIETKGREMKDSHKSH